MKVLLVHNYYQQPGGEDEVFATEGRLLEERGHQVFRYVEDNDRIGRLSRRELLQDTIWSRTARDDIRRLIRQVRPDVAHFHNTFPLISPAAYWAAQSAGVPVVQTLHNYRLLCPNAQFFRDGHACVDCLGKAIPWPGVLHACYRESRPASAAVAAMLSSHRLLGTWNRQVDRYIALTEFARQRFIEGGLPPEKIVVKPNFVHPDPGVGEGRGGYALFVGRLSREKGVQTLFQAWQDLEDRIPLKVIGDGPLAFEARSASDRLSNVEWLGRLPAPQVLNLMGDALCLVVPSEWFEAFPRVVAEAFARATPVIASSIGALAEIVSHGRTGLLFEPGNAADLASQVRIMSELGSDMRAAVRREYEQKYTAERNYETLLATYLSFRGG